jgi:hypothetical protein
MLIKLLERATFASTWSPFPCLLTKAFTRRLVTASNAWVAFRTFLVIPLGWDGPLPLLLPMTSCLSCGDISVVTTIISPLLWSDTLSLAQDVKPNSKPILTKGLNYYHLIQNPNADLSLRPYITILVQINSNLQDCIIKAVLVLTWIPYQILKTLKSNILKIIGIKTLYLLYIYNPSYVLIDHHLID